MPSLILPGIRYLKQYAIFRGNDLIPERHFPFKVPLTSCSTSALIANGPIPKHSFHKIQDQDRIDFIPISTHITRNNFQRIIQRAIAEMRYLKLWLDDGLLARILHGTDILGQVTGDQLETWLVAAVDGNSIVDYLYHHMVGCL